MEGEFEMGFYPFQVPSEFPVELAMLIAIWVETLLYGIYTCLFFKSLYITLARRRIQTRSRKVVLAAMVLMYMVATFDVALNFYRLLNAYVWWRDPSGPGSYFLHVRRWDHVANSMNYCIMVWLGDALVLYRCFIVWNESYAAITLPTLFLVLSTTTNTAIMFWFSHPPNVSTARLIAWVDSIYVVNLAQNMLTTGLIVFKILRQHRASAAAGARCLGAHLRLTHVVRILVESALVYTLQLLALIVLHTRRHNAQFIVQYSIVPTIGIVFNLISVRTHMTEPWDADATGAGVLTGLPRWVDERGGGGGGGGSARRSGETSSSDSAVEAIRPIGLKRARTFTLPGSLGRRGACGRSNGTC